MDHAMLTDFFKWCTIINGAFLLWSALWVMAAPDLVYRTQSKFFTMSREVCDAKLYTFMGIFKIAFVVFNLVPYIALTIIT